MIPVLIILVVLAIAAFVPALRALDNWLSRRLDRAWDADDDCPIYEATVKACGYRPGVGS